MYVTMRSALTGKIHSQEIAITPEQWKRWKAGEMIQDVCPHLSSDDREFLISGSTKEEWDLYMNTAAPEGEEETHS